MLSDTRSLYVQKRQAFWALTSKLWKSVISTMTIRAIFTVILFLFLAASTANTKVQNGHTNAITDLVVARVSASAPSSPASITGQEDRTPGLAIAAFRFEPFLLLLLGSALFGASGTIKLIISRRAGHVPVPRRAAAEKQSAGSGIDI